MTIAQLKYALELQKAESYQKAAKVLRISQPGLSLQIKKLEENLGFALFDRSARRVVPTEKGIVFLERAQLLTNEAKQLASLAESLKDSVTGVLRIGMIPTVAPYLLPLFIDQLNEMYTDLKIVIKEALTEEIVQELKAGTLDGGIIATPIASKVNFTSTPLLYEKFMLFVSSQHPLYQKEEIDIKEVPLEDVWLLSEGNCFRDQVNNICKLSKRANKQELFFYESSSIESLCRIVEFKGGITFLPELTTVQFGEDRLDLVKEITGAERVREISLVHLPNHVRVRDMEVFSEIVKRNVPKSLLRKSGRKTVPTNVEV